MTNKKTASVIKENDPIEVWSRAEFQKKFRLSDVDWNKWLAEELPYEKLADVLNESEVDAWLQDRTAFRNFCNQLEKNGMLQAAIIFAAHLEEYGPQEDDQFTIPEKWRQSLASLKK